MEGETEEQSYSEIGHVIFNQVYGRRNKVNPLVIASDFLSWGQCDK